MFKNNIREYIIAEDKSNLNSLKNETSINNCEINDKTEIINILKDYKEFKEEVMQKIKDPFEKIEIKCNANFYTPRINIQIRNQKIELMKNQIIKIEYFKGYDAAIRIEMDNGVYFINSIIDNELLSKYTYDIKRFKIIQFT